MTDLGPRFQIALYTKQWSTDRQGLKDPGFVIVLYVILESWSNSELRPGCHSDTVLCRAFARGPRLYTMSSNKRNAEWLRTLTAAQMAFAVRGVVL
jgi:hypothetical protein